MSSHHRLELVAFALLAYVPFLVSSPGRVTADTKQYLYLDPDRLLSRAAYLWDSHIGFGTVSHQIIGYLFPMGPFFWLTDHVGMPEWVAQRLWLGSISLAAALGARWLFRMLGVSRGGAIAGALVYMLTPYQLAFTARISVLLLAWAGLPWLVGLAMRAVRRGGWRDPALFALVILGIGSVNASSLVFVCIGPALWLLVDACRGRGALGPVVRAASRMAVLSLGVSLWWIVGLRMQGVYGLPILQLTESVRTVAADSSPTDILRGIGNWFFYGKDRLGYSIDQAAAYANNVGLQVVTYAIPVVALALAAITRWRHRVYFALLVVIGAIISIGAWPYDDPSPYGALFKWFAGDTAAGLALRNTPRAVPLLVLGLAGLVAAGVERAGPAPRFALAAGDRGRARARCPGAGADQRLPVAQSRPAGGGAAVLEGRHRRAEPRGHLDPDPRDPGLRLLGLPLGRHHRADHARVDRPPVRRARDPPVGLGALGEPARRARPPAPGRHLRARCARRLRAPRQHRHRRVALRPPVRAVRHAPAASPLATARRPAPEGPGRAAARSAPGHRIARSRRYRPSTRPSWRSRSTPPTHPRSRCST